MFSVIFIKQSSPCLDLYCAPTTHFVFSALVRDVKLVLYLSNLNIHPIDLILTALKRFRFLTAGPHFLMIISKLIRQARSLPLGKPKRALCDTCFLGRTLIADCFNGKQVPQTNYANASILGTFVRAAPP